MVSSFFALKRYFKSTMTSETGAKLKAESEKDLAQTEDQEWQEAVRAYSGGYENEREKKATEEEIKFSSREREPWTPKGIWGHKDPAEMTLDEKEKMLEKARYSGPLATAYWQNEINQHKEKPDREEAEVNRKRIKELEEEVKQLKKQLKENQKASELEEETPKETPGEETEETTVDQALMVGAEEEIKERKKGIGERFKDGVKNVYNFFRKKLKRGESKPGPDELSVKTIETETRETEEEIAKPEMSAEERAGKIEELRAEIGRLRKERYQLSREVGVIEQTKIEKEYAEKIKDLEGQILELEKGGREKITGKGVAGFLWERTKGFLGGFGWWEAHQTEKFRLGTKEAGQDLKAQSELLEQEEGLMLDPDEAWKEAHETESQRAEMELEMAEIGIESKDQRRLAIETISDQISGRKKEYNQKIEDKMVVSALAKLEKNLKTKSWAQEYMAANGGKVITPEKMKEVEKRIRTEIEKLRKGQTKKDFVDFVKLFRNALDKRWWSRYIYAGLDAVLAGLFFKWLVSRGVEKAVAGKAGKALEIGMKDTVWGETKRFLIERGLPNPTDAQVLEYAKMIAQDSGVTVPDWGITGKIIDTQMPAGYLLKFGRVAAELGKLAL